MFIEIKNLKKFYKNEQVVTKALDGVNLSINKNEFISIIGPSGGGKSTLLNMIGCLDFPTEGSIEIDGKVVSNLSEEERTIYRRKNIGFIFQDYNLINNLNVRENISLTLGLDNKRINRGNLDKIMNMLGIKEKLYDFPNRLSGGQQQRVAIARALMSNPKLILADEPTGNLDSKSSENVIKLIKKTQEELNQTVIMVTHNDELAKYGDRIIEL